MRRGYEETADSLFLLGNIEGQAEKHLAIRQWTRGCGNLSMNLSTDVRVGSKFDEGNAVERLCCDLGSY